MPKNKKKKRGAQLGNLNALKHGLYARPSQSSAGPPSLPGHPATLADFSELDTLSEARMIRVLLARHLEMRLNHPPATPEETLTDLRVISFAVARFSSLVRLQRNLAAEREIVYSENWMEELLAEINAGRLNPDPLEDIEDTLQ